jgi:putative FmdB family regulatory protein
VPTYDYVCAACGHALEVFQSMSEAPKKKCPACKRPKLERRIGAGAGFLFKGSGFYLTDYRSKAYTEAAQKERGAAGAKSEGSPSGGSSGAAAQSSDSKASDSKGADSKAAESKSVDAPSARNSPPAGNAKPAAKSAPKKPPQS